MGSGAALHSQIRYDYKQSHITWNKLNLQIAPHPFRSGFAAKYILSPNLIKKDALDSRIIKMKKVSKNENSRKPRKDR